MSGLLRPVGPEDPQVYWLRRAAILVGLVLVALLVVALARPGGSPTRAEPSASPTPLLLATPTPTPSATPIPTELASGGAEAVDQTPAPVPEEPATPTAPPACNPADLRLAVGGAQGAGIGTPSVFTVQVTNGSSVSCIAGWEPGAAELRIFSGTDRIWSTDDCEAWFATVPAQLVEPGASLTAEVTWQGQRSYPGCKLASAPLRAGTYVATAEIEGAPAAQQVLSLR